MSFKQLLTEKNDHEKFEIKEKNHHSPTTLEKIELAENDKNSPLLQDKKNAESLESIQSYAHRIKSFLGWESNVEENELECEADEVKIKDVDSSQNITVSPSDGESCKREKGIFEEKLNSLSAVSNREFDKKECENKMKCIENDESLIKVLAGEKSDHLVQGNDENFTLKENDGEMKEFITQEKESNTMDSENKNSNQHLLTDKNYTIENHTDSPEVGKIKTDKSKINDLTAEPNSSNADISYISNKVTDNLKKRDIRNGEILEIKSDVGNSSSISLEENKLNNSPSYEKTAHSPEINKCKEFFEPISTESTTYDLMPESEDREHQLKNEENINLINEAENIKLEAEEKKEPDSLFVSDLDPNAGEYISDLSTDIVTDSYSDPNVKNDKSKNQKSELSPSETDRFFTESNISSNEDCGMQIYDTEPSECLEKDNRNRKDENKDADDLRSEDSLELDEDILSESDLPNQYVKEIRRLSRGIVKDVIESARNSVHELYSSKGENIDKTSLSESLRNYDQIKDNQDFYFINDRQEENDALDFDKKNLEKFSVNLHYKNDQVEQGFDIEDKDTICGLGCFKPKWIQKYATSRTYLVIFSLIGIIHGCYYTYVVSIMSTLEKRYAFKSKVSGTLLLADEITPLILGILVGYIGGKTHRPRMVAIGMFLSAACCFISGLPYLLYGTSINTSYFNSEFKTGPKLCDSAINSSLCNSGDQPPTLSVVGIFLFASILKGFATLSFYVIGMSYMDDIIKRKNSSIYFAISLALRLLGPLVGFLMSSGFLKYYENPLYDPGFGPDDPRWIGAWWIGFFLQGVLLVIFTIPIALFPRRLPSQKKVEKAVGISEENGMKEIFTGLISALKRLGKNPVFIVLIINTTMKVFGHFGHSIMLPKYMENQFRLSASEASLYSGAVSILCIIISTILGGFLIWKFRPSIKVLLGGMIVSEIILCVGFLMLMIPKCQPSEMLHFGMDEDGLILNSVCNRNCDCSTSAFTPFCGQDGKTLYFSPCYAGCTEEMTSPQSNKINKEFGNCSCVDQQQVGVTISEGFCPDENCRGQMIAYLIILFILVTVSNLFTVAATMILLRSVHPSDKSVALGTFETFICLFGFIPFPVTYGALVDSACLVWEKSCGETGNCWFYDMDKYDYLLHGVSSLFSALSVVCLIALYFLSPRVRNLYVEEDEVEEETKYVVDIKLDTVSGSVTKL